MLELRTLGTVDLRSNGQTVLSILSQPVRLGVLAYLAVALPRGPHRRDVLTHLLWSEQDEQGARTALRQTLFRLRQSLGDDVIDGLGEQSVALVPDSLWCDVVAFDAALDAGRHAAGLELYRGPFLHGFYMPDSLVFERWVEEERQRLGRRAEKAARSLADETEGRGAFEEATLWARRGIELDPYDEAGWRRLMTLLDRQGERAAAVRAWEELTALLSRELDVEPSPETRALFEKIRVRRDAREPQPAERTEQPEPLTDGLTGQAAIAHKPPHSEPPDTAERMARPRRRNAVLAAAALLTLAVVGASALDLLPLRVSTDRPSSIAGVGPAAVQPPASAARAPARTIAVLPFVNLGGDPDQEYFTDGLTEELIAALARVRTLRVAARTSAFAYKGQTRDIREIARALGVATVLEGSVRLDGDRIRVWAQLIDASDGFHIWSDTYDRRVADLFEIQTDLALRIASALRAELTPAERARLTRRLTGDLDAYTLYLRGRYFWNTRSGGGLSAAIEYFRRAIDADPQFAAAYAGLASAYAPLGVFSQIEPAEGRERMNAAVQKAIALDPDLAEGRTALGAYLLSYVWDFAAAERELRRAIDLDPSYSTAHQWYGYLLESLGRADAAVEERTKALELEPLTPIMSSSLGSALRVAGEYDRALEHYRVALELDSTHWGGHDGLGKLLESMGDIQGAVAAFERAVAYAGASPHSRAGLARVLALSGKHDRARTIVDSLRVQAAMTGIHAPVVATAYLALGDVDAALDWLDRSLNERHPYLPHIIADGRFAAVENEARFRQLLQRIGLRSR